MTEVGKEVELLCIYEPIVETLLKKFSREDTGAYI